ncbi:MAG TPA: hypothetical protein VF541_07540 [Longimicrobium sp.]
MKTRIEHVDVPQPLWDPEEEKALEQRLIAAGFRMPTKSLDRPRVLARRRPAWLAFLMRQHGRVRELPAFFRELARASARKRKSRTGPVDVPLPEWDPEEEKALEARLIAAGCRMPTLPLDRPRVMARRRPRWKAILITLWQRVH